MRISEIYVEKLFGLFTYDIPLNQDNRTTILIGPNGYGKTAILKMINGLFTGNLSIFFKFPFTKFRVVFTDESEIFIEKRKKRKSKSGNGEKRFNFDLIFSYLKKDSESQELNLTDIESDSAREFLFYGTDFMRDEIIDRSTYRLLRSGVNVQNIDNIFPLYARIYDSFSKELQSNESRIKQINLPGIFRNEFGSKLLEITRITKSLNVHFIQTQRLIYFPSGENSEKEVPVVNRYSAELAQLIETTLAQSTQKAQILDSTFPRRIVTKETFSGSRDTFTELLAELEQLRNKRVHLKDTGILVDLGNDLEITELDADENRLDFLNGVLREYIADTRQKLAIFDELASKIELFKKIINERFSFKQLAISKEKGFIFTTESGEELSPDLLSSGEQHELVMFFEFLFKVPQGSLLLIDEPELSLHIEWQQKFLRDLIDIAKLAKFDVLVATHSASIINNFWTLTVDLGDFTNGNKK